MNYAQWPIKGFTLIEIIIVILLGSLIIGLVSPGIIRSMQRSELNQVGKNLVSDLRYARAQALINNREERITFNLNDNSYKVPQKNRTVTIPDTLTLTLVTAESELDQNNIGGIRFFPNGSSTGGHITLTGKNKTWEISVAWLTGNIELQRQHHD